MTSSTLHRPGCSPVHGPAEVRAALEPHADRKTLEVFDQDVDQAATQALEQQDVEPLAKVLERWWRIAQVAATARRGEDGMRAHSQDEVLAEWQRRHPGETLNAA